MRKFLSLIIASGILFGIVGCSPAKTDDRLTVAVSVFPAYDFVRAITGGNADIRLLIDPGSSVHSYDPSPADITSIASADLFIYTGGISDSWAEKIISGTGVKKSLKMMDCCENLLHEVHSDGEYEDHQEVYDEHVWTSPDNCISIINAITTTLCEIDGKNASVYLENAEKYTGQIREIDTDLKEFIKTSARNKIVVADKFPFYYLTQHYGLQHLAVFDSCNDQADADPASIARIIDTVKCEKLPCIYYVELTSGNIARSVGEQTGAKVLLLHSMQNVSKDDFSAGITCVDLMRSNAENLKRGLS